MSGVLPVLTRAGRFALLPAVVLTAVCFLTGCGGGQVTPIADTAAFHQIVDQASQPALVYFYKGGCGTCVALDGTIDRLAQEYQGRVVVAKYQLITAFFKLRSPELQKRFHVNYFPTVVLLVDGQERQRWVVHYNIKDYRAALDEAIAAQAARAPAVQSAVSKG